MGIMIHDDMWHVPRRESFMLNQASTLPGGSNDEPTGEVFSTTGPPPKVEVKPGYQKSEGQLTILFVMVAAVMSLLGFKYSPLQVQNAYEAIQTLIYTLGPLLAAVPILKNYINSRGKIASNSVWANAGLLNPAVSKDGVSPMALGLLGGKFDLGSILGGKDWKDPKRYIDIGKLASGVIPGGAVAGKILDTVTGGGSGGGVAEPDPEFAKEVEQGFQLVTQRLNDMQTVVVAQWNIMRPDLPVQNWQELSTTLAGMRTRKAQAAVSPLPPQATAPTPSTTGHSDK